MMKKFTIAELIATKPLNLIVFVNSTFEEQKCLYELDMKKVLLIGDYYHDKIDEKIDGFLQGLKFLEVPYEIGKLTIHPPVSLFSLIGFINEG